MYQELYTRVAEKWVRNACFTHALTFFAHDTETIDLWFWQGFGLRCVDSICESKKISANNTSPESNLFPENNPSPEMRIHPDAETFVSEHKDIMNITGAYVLESERKAGMGTMLLGAVQE